MDARDFLIDYAIANQGDWDDIYKCVCDKKEVNHSNFVGECLTILDIGYPQRLKERYKPPFVLFYKGDISLIQNDNIVSTVGTRNPTEEGKNAVAKLLKDFDVIINGGAAGIEELVIDTAKRPIIVLPCGLDKEADLVNRVVEKGGLVLTEFPNGTFQSNNTTMQRVRIIEALANKTLVVEAIKHSAANIRIAYALQNGNDVFAVPHSLNDDNYNNVLLSEGATPCLSQECLL